MSGCVIKFNVPFNCSRAAAIGNYKIALELLMKRREEHLTDVHRAVIKSLKAKEELGK